MDESVLTKFGSELWRLLEWRVRYGVSNDQVILLKKRSGVFAVVTKIKFLQFHSQNRPGINTVCPPHNVSARIGYCLDSPEDICAAASGHVDAAIGVGLKTLNPEKINAPYGGYTVYNNRAAPNTYHQTWILAL